uniref:Uncharacterized protein n=1 Tax=Anguilla anguilla TaxID=7936 RepID=A0A0E9QJM8_ANGAN
MGVVHLHVVNIQQCEWGPQSKMRLLLSRW